MIARRMIVLTLVFAMAPVLGAQDPQATFRTSTNRVSVDVSVRREGRPVTGLAATDFELFDNGVKQNVIELSYEQLPIDVTVALDVSGSVTGSLLDQLRRAVRQLRTDLSSRDRLRLITFNNRVQQVADFAAPADKTDAAFDHVAAGGGSAILDTLAVALATPVPADRRQLIVLFSDGEDTSSITDNAALLSVARRTTPTVAVVLATPAPLLDRSATAEARVAAESARKIFNDLATETGGSVVTLAPNETLPGAFRRVLEQFRSTYVLRFAPEGVPRAGVHTLQVKVARPGTFDVRARAGYVWK
jgi:VWFA-related protein